MKPSEYKSMGKKVYKDPKAIKFLDAKYEFEQPIKDMLIKLGQMAEEICDDKEKRWITIHSTNILNILVPAWVRDYQKQNPDND